MQIEVNNIKLYYEISGNGDPIVLVHGNGETHEVFDVLIDRLKKDYTVYALDSRCHGKSENPKEISYDLMAEDVISFIEKLGLKNPILYGFSDGGIVGLLVAIKRPKLLSKLIISGANLSPKGLTMGMRLTIRLGYVFTGSKLFRLMVKEPNISVDDLAKIETPTYVLAGERDIVKEEHTRLIARSIKRSRLKILPREKHGSYIVHSEKIYKIIRRCLADRKFD